MSDELRTLLESRREKLAAELNKTVRMLAMLDEESQPGRHAKPKRKGSKPGKARKGRRPTKGAGAPVSRSERKAQGLKLLAEGKSPEEVAKALGVTSSAVYYWRSKAA